MTRNKFPNQVSSRCFSPKGPPSVCKVDPQRGGGVGLILWDTLYTVYRVFQKKAPLLVFQKKTHFWCFKKKKLTFSYCPRNYAFLYDFLWRFFEYMCVHLFLNLIFVMIFSIFSIHLFFVPCLFVLWFFCVLIVNFVHRFFVSCYMF